MFIDGLYRDYLHYLKDLLLQGGAECSPRFERRIEKKCFKIHTKVFILLKMIV